MRKRFILKVILFFVLFAGMGAANSSNVKADAVAGLYNYRVYNGTVTITRYTGAESSVVVPAAIEGKAVTSIDYGAFQENDYIISVSLPATVMSVGNRAFYHCANLTAISGTENVTSIGYSAFDNCSKLTGISFGKLETVGYEAFRGCTSITGIVLPASVKHISDEAFGNCDSITEINIPDAVAVDEYAFYDCDALAAVSIGSSVTMEGSVFSGCSKLASVSVGANTSISNYCFNGCKALTSVAIAAGTEKIYIYDHAFKECSSLSKVAMPSNLRGIYDYAFENCSALKNIALRYGICWLDEGAFYNCTALERIVIPNSVWAIYKAAFSGCISLRDVTLPNSVVSIGNYNRYDSFSSSATWVFGNATVFSYYAGSYAEQYLTTWQNKVEQGNILPAVFSSSLTFTPPTVYMNVDEWQQLVYVMTPGNTTDAIDWESSASDIVSVNAIGEVTAKKVGTATIIAVTTSGIRTTINVVVANKPSSVSFSKKEETIMVGQTCTQRAVVKDPTGVRPDILPTYESSNPAIAAVNAEGVVTGLSEGTVKITAKTGNLSASYIVNVVSNAPTSVTFGISKKTVVVGHTFTQKARVMGALGEMNGVKPVYSSSNPKVASVSGDGKVKGKKAGTAIIRAKAGGLTASYKVTVEMMQVKKSGKTLTVTTIPKANVTVKANKDVLGSSSKKVKANAKGTAKIKFKKKIKGTVKITVAKSGYKKKTITKKY